MSDLTPNPETRIALFQRKEIRRTIHNNEWWFVIEDVVFALTDSADPKQYIQRMKQRDPELGKGWVQIVHTLSIPTAGGPQNLNCANAEGKVVSSQNYLVLSQVAKKAKQLKQS
jgi:prophage antirepressor-like protein